jgi:uncharacterized protein
LVWQNAKDILDAFVADENKYNVILIDRAIIDSSQMLIQKYGISGLRSLDAIQLASACSVKSLIDLAISGDKLLNSFLSTEQIKAFA